MNKLGTLRSARSLGAIGLVAAGLAVAGCGSDDDSSSEGTAAAPPAATTTEAPFPPCGT